MNHRPFRQLLVLSWGIILISVTSALCAGFPEKPITVIVGFAAGSGNDIEARALAPFLQKHLGTAIMVENLVGAEGKIALTRIWKSKPDGYTITIHPATMAVINQYMLEPEYRILEFSHIFSWAVSNQALLANSETYKTFDEFIKDARKRTLAAGTPGLGTTSHLSGMMLADGLGIKINWVPFSKDIVFPDVPLAKDLGFDFPVIPLLRGADGPPNIPLPIIEILEAAFAKAIREPAYVSWADKRMSQLQALGHVEYGKALERQQQEVEKYKSFLKKQ